MKTKSGGKKSTSAKKPVAKKGVKRAPKTGKKSAAATTVSKRAKTTRKSTKKSLSTKGTPKKAAVKKSAATKSVAKKATKKATASKTAKKVAKKVTKKTTKRAVASKTVANKSTANKTVQKSTKKPNKPAPAPRSTPASRKSQAVREAATLRDFSVPPLPRALDIKLHGEDYREALRVPLRNSGLPRRIAHGAVLPALLAAGRMKQLRDHLDWALEERVPAFYLAESLLQSYLFIGFPRVITALGALHEVNRDRRRQLGLAADPLHVPTEIPSLDRILGGPGDFGSSLKGRRIRLAEGPPMHLESPGEGPGSFERYAREWWRRGSELCRSIYGDQYARLRENLGRIHPELADWMVFEGYGKVLARPILTPRERELWIIPLLMGQDAPEQLYSHLRGARHLEVPPSRIRAVLWLAGCVTGPTILSQAQKLLKDIEKRESRRGRDFED